MGGAHPCVGALRRSEYELGPISSKILELEPTLLNTFQSRNQTVLLILKEPLQCTPNRCSLDKVSDAFFDSLHSMVAYPENFLNSLGDDFMAQRTFVIITTVIQMRLRLKPQVRDLFDSVQYRSFLVRLSLGELRLFDSKTYIFLFKCLMNNIKIIFKINIERILF